MRKLVGFFPIFLIFIVATVNAYPLNTEPLCIDDNTDMLFHFNETSGSYTYDAVNNSVYIYNTSMGWTTGKFDYALTGFGKIENSTGISLEFNYTLDFWVYLTTSEKGSEPFLVKRNPADGSDTHISITLQSDGKIRTYFYTGYGSAEFIDTPVAVPLNEWIHITTGVWTIDESNYMVLMINETLDNLKTFTVGSIYDPTFHWYINYLPAGKIDEIRVSSVERYSVYSCRENGYLIRTWDEMNPTDRIDDLWIRAKNTTKETIIDQKDGSTGEIHLTYTNLSTYGMIEIRVDPNGYAPRTFVNLPNYNATFRILDYYILEDYVDADWNIIQVVNAQTGAIIENVFLNITKLIDSDYKTMASYYTDASGSTGLYLKNQDEYIVYLERAGYQDGSATITPVGATIQLSMTPLTNYTWNYTYEGIEYQFLPIWNYFEKISDATLQFIISARENDLEYYGLNGTYNRYGIFNPYGYSNWETENDLVGFWKFDEGTGTIAYDSSQYGNNGSISGANWTDGLFWDALFFNDTDNYVQIFPLYEPLNTTFSISLWINSLSKNDQHRIIEKGINQDWKLLWHNDLARFVQGNSLGNVVETNITLNEWTHLIITYDGMDMIMYKDGVNVSTNTHGEFTDISEKITIGNFGGTKLYGSNSSIDQVMVFNRTLTSDEINYLYYDGLSDFQNQTNYDANGGDISLVFNVTNSINGLINSTAFFKRINYNETQMNRLFYILNYSDATYGNYTLNYLFDTELSGLDWMTKLIIAIFITILVTAGVSMKNPTAGGIVALLTMGFFIGSGFLEITIGSLAFTTIFILGIVLFVGYVIYRSGL